MKQDATEVKNFEIQHFPHLKAVYCTVVHVTGSTSTARDVTVESYVKVFFSGHNCRACLNSRARLFRAMTNVLNEKRSKIANSDATRHRSPVPSGSTDQLPPAGFAQLPVSSISLDDVSNAIESLPYDHRLALILSLQEGFSYREIAYITGSDPDSAKLRVHHGRRLMRKRLIGELTHSTLKRTGQY